MLPTAELCHWHCEEPPGTALLSWVKGETQAPKAATTVDGRWTVDPREVVAGGGAAVWGAL